MSPPPDPAVANRRPSAQELAAIALGRGDDAPGFAAMYLRTRGRITRRAYWLDGVLPLLLALVVGNGLLDIAGFPGQSAVRLALLPLAWALVAVAAKRLHDWDRSAWWLLAALVPVVGLPGTLLVDGLVPGRRGPNRYGPDPLALRARHRLVPDGTRPADAG